jgi:hypothetical protein
VGHSRPDIAGTAGVLQYIVGQTRPDITGTHFLWWVITMMSFCLWYFNLMDDEEAIWIARKTWILVQTGPLGQFIMVWWIVGHIKVKNRNKELFEGHTHYGGMPYRLEFFCHVDITARRYKSPRIKRFKYHVHCEQEKRRKEREREARRKLVEQFAAQEQRRKQREHEFRRKLVQQLAEQLFDPEFCYRTYRQGQPWCPKTRFYDDDARDEFCASIDPLRLFHVLSSDLMEPKVKTGALRGKRLQRCHC